MKFVYSYYIFDFRFILLSMHFLTSRPHCPPNLFLSTKVIHPAAVVAGVRQEGPGLAEPKSVTGGRHSELRGAFCLSTKCFLQPG